MDSKLKPYVLLSYITSDIYVCGSASKLVSNKYYWFYSIVFSSSHAHWQIEHVSLKVHVITSFSYKTQQHNL